MRQRSKKKLFAWFMCLVMVLSINANCYVGYAEGNTIADYVDAMGEIIVGEAAITMQDSDAVSITDSQYECFGDNYILKKITIPAQTGIVLKANYNGQKAATEEQKKGWYFSVLNVSDSYNSGTYCLNNYEDELAKTEVEVAIVNADANDKTYVVAFNSDATNNAINDVTIAAIPYNTSYTPTELAEGTNNVTTMDYIFNPYSTDVNSQYINASPYHITVPSDKNYMVEFKYTGTPTEDVNTKYWQVDFYEVDPSSSMSVNNSYLLDSETYTAVTHTFNPGKNYYIYLSGTEDVSDISITVREAKNVSELIDTADSIDKVTNKSYEVSADYYTADCGGWMVTSKGKLLKTTVDSTELRAVKAGADTNIIVYSEMDGQISCNTQLSPGAGYALQDINMTGTTYYLWLYSNSANVSLDINEVNDITTIKEDAKDITADIANPYSMTSDMLASYAGEGSSPDVNYGQLFKIDIPSGETINISATDSAEMESFNIKAYDKNFAYVSQGGPSIALNNIEDAPKTYYLWVYTYGLQSDIKISKVEVKSISELIGEAKEISDVGTEKFFDTTSDKMAANSSSSVVAERGALVKVNVPANKIMSAVVGMDTAAIAYTEENGQLVYSSEPDMMGNTISLSNDSDTEKTYYLWLYRTWENEEVSVTINKVPDISELKDSAVDITNTTEYLNVTTDAYSAAESNSVSVRKGSLAKVTVVAGSTVNITSDVNIIAYKKDFTYCKTNYGSMTLSNSGASDETYYLWLWSNDDWVTQITASSSAVNKLSSLINSVDTLVIGDTYEKSYDDVYYEIDMEYTSESQKGKLTKLTVPAGKNLEITTYAGTCVYIFENQNGDLIYTQKMISDNTTDKIINSEASDKVYYLWLNNNMDAGTVKISVNEGEEIFSISDIMGEAADISVFKEYKFLAADYERECLVEYLWEARTENGILTKVEIPSGGIINVQMGDTFAEIFLEENGELVHQEEGIYNNDTVILSNLNSDESLVYYLWLRSQEEYYEITTSENKLSFLEDVENQAVTLVEGDNVLEWNTPYIDAWKKEESWTPNSNDPIYDYVNVKGGLYKYEIPAYTETTFTWTAKQQVYEPMTIYGDLLLFGEEDIYQESTPVKSYTVNNTSSEARFVHIYVPYSIYETWDETYTYQYNAAGTLNISNEELEIMPTDKSKVYVYSFDGGTKRCVFDRFIEKYPEYADKVEYINLNLPGTSDKYLQTIEDIAANSAGYTVIFTLDISILQDMLSKDIFASMESIGFDITKYDNIYGVSSDNAYDYTVEMGTYNDELMAVSYEICPGCFVYDEDIAMEVLGTKDPEEIQAMIDTPAQFLEVAELMKQNGYYMTTGVDLLEGVAKYTFNKLETEAFYDEIVANGYTTGNDTFTQGWYEDMESGKVFGTFGAPWFIDDINGQFLYCDDMSYSVCEGTTRYPWGGSFQVVVSDNTNTATDQIAATYLQTICCDKEILRDIAIEERTTIPNNMALVDELISEGLCTNKYLSRHPYEVWDANGNRILKGLWESKCIDGKFVIPVDENNQINLSTNPELALAGFIFSNFEDATGNGTYDPDTGVLTVTDIGKVVDYRYVENGVPCDLQFIAFRTTKDNLKNVSSEVFEKTVVQGDETTDTYIEVTSGKISGQIDKIEVDTDDVSTKILVVEDKDKYGAVVEDASLSVEQDTISEDTLNQSIEVANKKTEKYKSEGSDAEITTIEAEFKDDSSKTTISDDFFKKLMSCELSFEISKKVGGDIEYKWSFDNGSIKKAGEGNIKTVDTKLTIHGDGSYEANENVEAITGEDAINCVLEFNHEGKLPGVTTVSVNIDNKYEEGQLVYYYHFDPVTNKMTYTGKTHVNDGYVDVTIDHCSDYVVTTEIIETADNITEVTKPDNNNNVNDNETEDDTDKPTTGDETPLAGVMTLALMSMLGIAILYLKKKHSNICIDEK